MASSAKVALYCVTSGDRVARAREKLAEALGEGASLGEPDDAGVFEVSLDAPSSSDASERLRAALAESGTGDDFVIRESAEDREMPADDPRQAEAGMRPETSTPAGSATGTAEPSAAQQASTASRYVVPGVVALLLLALLRRRRRR